MLHKLTDIVKKQFLTMMKLLNLLDTFTIHTPSYKMCKFYLGSIVVSFSDSSEHRHCLRSIKNNPK